MSATTLPTPTAAELAFELEKAAITSYEEGWDRWDGPIYPIGYIQCRMRKSSTSTLCYLSWRRRTKG